MAFTINYKGTSCRGTLFIYLCGKCGHEQESVHPAREEPMVVCEKCCYAMNKKPVVFSLDADHHDSMRSHNIGWDEDA
jgi:hypothetical protein